MIQSWRAALPPLFLFVTLGGIGYVARRLGWIGSATDEALSQLLYRLTIPALIFVNTVSRLSQDMLAGSLGVAGVAVGLALAGLALGLIVARWLHLDPLAGGAFAAACAFPNTIFLGLPVSLALVGPTAVPFVVLYDFGTTLVFWTVGVRVMQGHYAWSGPGAGPPTVAVNGWRRALLNPNFLALLTGTVLVVAGVRVPTWLLSPLDRLGQVTVPLALLQVGSLVARLGGKGTRWRAGGVVAILRLAILPALATLFAAGLLPAGSDMAKVIVVEAAMPTMMITALFAEALGADTSMATSGVVVTVLASLVQLPFLGWFLSFL